MIEYLQADFWQMIFLCCKKNWFG